MNLPLLALSTCTWQLPAAAAVATEAAVEPAAAPVIMDPAVAICQ